MNDFTKEEWQVIYGFVENDFYVCNLSKAAYVSLISKIQSMIDNYDKRNPTYDPGLPYNCPRCDSKDFIDE